MTASRFGRMQKAAAVVPLALLSAAWTASLAASAESTVGVAAPTTVPGGVLPDGSSIPSAALDDPASVSDAGEVTGTVGGVKGNAQQIVATSSTNGIPSAALAAYQRAETVINAADPSCRLSWQLVAAIGRVESDHGRFGGNALDADGIARPGIVGIPLNGLRGTALIRDTDAGQYDADKVFDRAVGPMQFIPSTWSVVGVDADNDGVRNPQDIDDAALATAVYLCSGDDDLSTLAGQQSAVHRYNHSDSYVDLVLSIMDNYLDGDFTSVPNGTTAAGYLVPTPGFKPPKQPGRNDQPTVSPEPTGTPAAEPVEPTEQPTDEPSDEPTDEPTKPPSNDPTLPLPPITIPALPQTSIEPVDDILTLAQAIVQCTLDGKIDNLLRNDDPFDKCVEAYTTGEPQKP